jgi:hypothetical protein
LQHNGGGFGGGSIHGGAPMLGILGGGGAGMGSYAKGTPVHYMTVSGVPPPGIGQNDLCFFCHGRGVQQLRFMRT